MNKIFDLMVRMSESVYRARKGQISSMYHIGEITHDMSGKK